MNNPRTAIISGATGYLGETIARRLAEDGMSLALLYHHASDESISVLLASLKGTGHRAYRCDLRDEHDVKTVLDRINTEMGHIYACIHTAGMKPVRKSLFSTSLDEIREQFEVNVFGSWNLLGECGRRFKTQKNGVMIGITTIGVLAPQTSPFLGGYLPAKYGLQGILATCREELKSSNCRVYSVAPGFMAGGMNKDIPEAFKEIVRQKNPSEKITTASDVAERVSYLCSDASAHETALTHPVAEEYTPQ